jgi:hypothetical protein
VTPKTTQSSGNIVGLAKSVAGKKVEHTKLLNRKKIILYALSTASPLLSMSRCLRNSGVNVTSAAVRKNYL